MPDGATALTITVDGLQGGHSGVDIDKGRGHATHALVRLLLALVPTTDLGLAELHGGTADNAIPRTASAVVTVPSPDVRVVTDAVAAFAAVLANELSVADPGVTIRVAPADATPTAILDAAARDTALAMIEATPQGVLRMSDAVPGLVETSTNLGVTDLADGTLTLTSLSRSSVATQLDAVAAQLAAAWGLAGAEVSFDGRYSGWAPDPDSPILALMEGVYQQAFGTAPVVSAIHAGLEASEIIATYPGMDAISIGPTIVAVHSPSEHLDIASVSKLDRLLGATLEAIAAR